MSKFVDILFLFLFLILLAVLELQEVSIIGIFLFLVLFLMYLHSIIFRLLLIRMMKINGREVGGGKLTILPLIGVIFCGKKVAAQMGYDNYIVLLFFVFASSLIFSMVSMVFVKDAFVRKKNE